MSGDAAWFRAYRATRPGPIPHGTDNAYVNYGCRCRDCTRAHRDARRSDRTIGPNVSLTSEERVTHQ